MSGWMSGFEMRTPAKRGVTLGFFALFAALAAAGCVRLSPPDQYGCSEPSDCNDDEVCSRNTCIAKGTCREPEDCAAGQRCDTNGNCVASQCSYSASAACVPYACEAGACKTSCQSSSDCQSGARCVANLCVNSQALADGLDCTQDFDCKSQSCCNHHCATSCSGDLSSCATASTCSGGYCCQTSIGLECRSSTCPTARSNEPCSKDSDCISDLCSSNRCL